jgi:hypothetical protein
MRYLKKYNESKITTLDTLSDDELRERLKWLRIEQQEINTEIGDINKLLTSRKEESQREYSTSLPENIFDFNKDQFDWLFEHHHGTTSEHYKIAQNYFRQLKGVHQSGFNENTKQFYFNITTSSCFNRNEDEFVYNEEVDKSITLLGENLKKHDGYVKFGISYTFDDNYNYSVLYYTSSDIRYKQGWGSVDMRRGENKGSVQLLLKSVVEEDLENKDND